jgi:YggT family protein
VEIICFILTMAYYALIVWIILSYVVSFGRLPYGHPVRRAFDGLASVINPVLAPIRGILPPLRLGGVALDLSPLLLFFGLVILQRVIC